MLYSIAAGAVLLVHLAFIVFAVTGAFLAIRWRWVPCVHLPAVAWASYVEVAGRTCPLTYWENHLRGLAGRSGYSEGFIEHYLLPVIYPGGLTPAIQYWLAGVVVAVNAAVYGWLIARRRPRPARAVVADDLSITPKPQYP